MKSFRDYITLINEADVNINVSQVQQAAKVKAYQDAIAAGKSEAEAQNAEAAAGNLAGANALSKVNVNDPNSYAAYTNQPKQGPKDEAERQEWMKDPTAPAAKPAPAQGAKQWGAGVLGMGSSGPEVEELQKKLGIPADGKFGPVTRQAVMDLQKKLGVTDDGAYGPITRAAHEKMLAGQPQPDGAAKPTTTQPPYTPADPAKGTIAGATQAIPTGPTAPAAINNGSGVGKNATLDAGQMSAAQDAVKDPNVSVSDKAALNQYIANTNGTQVPVAAKLPGNVGPRPVNPQLARQWTRNYIKTHDPISGNPLQETLSKADTLLLDKMLTIAGLR